MRTSGKLPTLAALAAAVAILRPAGATHAQEPATAFKEEVMSKHVLREFYDRYTVTRSAGVASSNVREAFAGHSVGTHVVARDLLHIPPYRVGKLSGERG